MKTSIASAEHYTWGGTCDGWHLVHHPSLGVIQERMPPGTSEARHAHRLSRQFFYVLSGLAAIEIDSVIVELRSGEGLEVAPGTPHQVVNPGPAPLEFLVISHPHSHGDRVPA